MGSPLSWFIRHWLNGARQLLGDLRRRRHVSKQRAGDIPRSWLPRYYLYRYGHQLAYLLVGLGCFIALAVLVHFQDNQRKTDEALAALIKNIQIDRRNATGQICGANNAVVLRVRQLIVQGAVASKPFEKIYRAYGLPSYAQRVKAAKDTAASVPFVPCSVLIQRIERATPPPPHVP
jgi:hypothetical protein